MKFKLLMTGVLCAAMTLGIAGTVVYASPTDTAVTSEKEEKQEEGLKVSLSEGGTVTLQTEENKEIRQIVLRTDGDETTVIRSTLNADETVETVTEDAEEIIDGTEFLFEESDRKFSIKAEADEDYELSSVMINGEEQKTKDGELEVDPREDEKLEILSVKFSDVKKEEKEEEKTETKEAAAPEEEKAEEAEEAEIEEAAVPQETPILGLNESEGEGQRILLPVNKGGLKVQIRDAKNGTAQGDATLEDAELSVISLNTDTISLNDKEYNKGDVVTTLKTDANGAAETDIYDIPCGLYEIRQAKAPEGYCLDPEWKMSVIIKKNGEISDLTDHPIEFMPVTGKIKVKKTDAELRKLETIAGGMLTRSTFEITNASKENVWVDGKYYKPGDVITTVKTDASGRAVTKKNMLPYGTYEVTELPLSTDKSGKSSNAAYLMPEENAQTIEIRENGKTVKATFRDQIKRSDIHFTKKDGDEKMSLIPFVIEQLDTGEKHVILTDKKGFYSSERYPHSLDTNKLDYLLEDYDEEKGIESDKLESYQFGTWFGLGREGGMADVNDNLQALPYGKYRISELRCEANEDKDLAAGILVDVRKNGKDIKVDVTAEE